MFPFGEDPLVISASEESSLALVPHSAITTDRASI
jgi:hypothetical protein